MPFIPLGDSNPRILLRYPWVTWGTILACILIYAAQISDGLQLSVYNYGFIPAVFAGDTRLSDELLQLPSVLTLFTSMSKTLWATSGFCSSICSAARSLD